MSNHSDSAPSAPLATLQALPPLLSVDVISDRTRAAFDDIIQSGSSPNTIRSYTTALQYWEAWCYLRYGRNVPLPMPASAVVQFIVDHFDRRQALGPATYDLPIELDRQLVADGYKKSLGPLTLTTIRHRIAVLSWAHKCRDLPNPCEDPVVRQLIRKAQRASQRRGDQPRIRTAALRSDMRAMLATCDDSLAGVRDRAILLFAWSSGGRRRSEVAGALVSQLRVLGPDRFELRLGATKTDQDGRKSRAPKPIVGEAGRALSAWLSSANIEDGPIFRRIFRSGRIGAGLSGAAISDVIAKHAKLAGLPGNWGGHSTRHGFVTQAGIDGEPLGDVMAMTDQVKVDTTMKYYQAGAITTKPVATLIDRETD